MFASAVCVVDCASCLRKGARPTRIIPTTGRSRNLPYIFLKVRMSDFILITKNITRSDPKILAMNVAHAAPSTPIPAGIRKMKSRTMLIAIGTKLAITISLFFPSILNRPETVCENAWIGNPIIPIQVKSKALFAINDASLLGYCVSIQGTAAKYSTGIRTTDRIADIIIPVLKASLALLMSPLPRLIETRVATPIENNSVTAIINAVIGAAPLINKRTKSCASIGT